VSVAVILHPELGGDAFTRVLSAYDSKDAPVRVDVHVTTGQSQTEAWFRGAANACEASDARYLHFTSDRYEPWPGWLPDALAAANAGMVPSPTLWSADGVPIATGRDWAPQDEGSVLPFVTRKMFLTLDRLAITQAAYAETAASFGLRSAQAQSALSHVDEQGPLGEALRQAGAQTVHRSMYAFTVAAA
jgi:hypothetical protein